MALVGWWTSLALQDYVVLGSGWLNLQHLLGYEWRETGCQGRMYCLHPAPLEVVWRLSQAMEDCKMIIECLGRVPQRPLGESISQFVPNLPSVPTYLMDRDSLGEPSALGRTDMREDSVGPARGERKC